jgi:Predicted EndoIII-related endonuclease
MEMAKKRALAINRTLKKLHPKATIALNYGNNWELLVVGYFIRPVHG